jgi:predicted Zn-dependent protease
MVIVRSAMTLVAIAACAWFVVGIRQAHEIDSATAIVMQGRSAGPAQLAKAGRLLASAGFFNPDREVDILRGRLEIAQSHSQRAVRILQGVTHSEPLDLEGWIWLAGASLGDRHELEIALAHLAKLDPKDAG